MSKEFKYNDKYQFTQKWFDPMITSWFNVFDYFTEENEVNDVLEIGCFEGRATVFLLENYLKEGTNYTVVDTFGGTLEEDGMKVVGEKLRESDFIYDNFSHNISHFPEINFTIHRDYSQYRLPKLEKEGKRYDVIYIDASHRADDTFVDAYYAHKMLKPGGLIIFDDFGWKDPNRPHIADSPELGIRMFNTMYDREYNVIGGGYQVVVQRRKEE